MPDAKKRPTTSRDSAKTAPARTVVATLPSAADLGRIYRQTLKQQAILDRAWMNTKENTKAQHDTKEAFDQITHEGAMLIQLIMLRPITTLADAATIAVHGFLRAESAEETDLQRVFARIALVVGQAAGVEPGDFGSDETAQHLRRFAAPGRAV